MLNILFDNIYCINLKRRTDRLNAFTQQAEKFNFTFERFEAIESKGSKGINPEAGCRLSHTHVLIDGLEKGYKNILIFEDDAVLNVSTNEILKKAWKDLQDWNMLYLGYSYHKKTHITDNISLLSLAYTTHAYAVNRQAIPLLLKVIYQNHPVDHIYANEIHDKGKCFAVTPMCAAQADGLSDVTRKYEKYAMKV